MKITNLVMIVKQGIFQVINILGKHNKMYLPKERTKLIKKTLQAILSSSKINYDTFSSYLDCNQGKSLVLCGSGPSLSKYRPLSGALHCSLNRAFENATISFDYLFACDWNGIKSNQDGFRIYPAVKFCGSGMSNPDENIPDSYIRYVHAKRFIINQFWTDTTGELNLQQDISLNPLAIGNTVAIPAMQFLLWTNPAKIYIVGCDCAPTGHFCQLTPEFEKIYQTSINHNCYAKQLMEWKALKEFAETYYPKTQIISMNPVGLKGVFTDVFTDASNGQSQTVHGRP